MITTLKLIVTWILALRLFFLFLSTFLTIVAWNELRVANAQIIPDKKPPSQERPLVVEVSVRSFHVKGNGTLRVDWENTWRHYHPPHATLCLDEALMSAIVEDEATRKKLAGYRRDIQEEIEQLYKSARHSSNNRDDTAVRACVAKVQEIENLIANSLSPRASSVLDDLIARHDFYRLGPVDFANETGLSPAEIVRVRGRLGDQLPELQRDLLAVENEVFTKVLSAISEERFAELIELLPAISTNRSAVLGPVHGDLIRCGDLESLPVNDLRLQPCYTLSPGGYIVIFRHQEYFPVADIADACSVQDWTIPNKAVFDDFFDHLFRESLRLDREFVETRNALLRNKANTSSPISKAAIDDEIEEINLALYRDKLELADTIIGFLPEDLGRQLRYATLIALMQRNGPVTTLFSERGQMLSGVTINRTDFRKLKRALPKITESMEARVCELQSEFFQSAFSETSVLEGGQLAWQDRRQPYGLPPLELVAQGVETSIR